MLIANRGEIALRIARACRTLGIPSVSVFSEADREALFVRVADEAICIGPASARHSYLNYAAILSAAHATGADEIHPGYGFLSEDAEFAALVESMNSGFIGPSSEVMLLRGNKVSAKEAARCYELPTLDASPALRDPSEAMAWGDRVGFPLMVKASGGGGGRGLRVVQSPGELERACGQIAQEVRVGFSSDTFYLERYLERPKHIELQVLADAHGGVWIVGDRECSLQRRHQKVIEEAPSPSLTLADRTWLYPRCVRAMRESGYVGLGTLEFLRAQDGTLFFVEMNTRLQVEHPVTEMVFGVDLVCLQIRAAAGEHLDLNPAAEWRPRGHAIECRINAEDPRTMAPRAGQITRCHWPGGPGIRIDTGYESGSLVHPEYDSLLAKIIAHAPTRSLAMIRLARAVDEAAVDGLPTNLVIHQALLADEEVCAGSMHTGTVDRVVRERASTRPPIEFAAEE